MLTLAAAKLPGVRLAQADILGAWPDEFRRHYDLIVSAYAFHHFEPAEKVDFLVRLLRDHVAVDGKIIVADIAFSSLAALDDARTRCADGWDEEHYWVVDRDLAECEKAGLHVRYEPITDFAGVFIVT
jgi:putative AdoMet-dependent methyltransferase